jgi:hypothetical protein
MTGSAARMQVRLELPREALAAEREAASADYSLGEPAPLPPDPDAVEARFVEPVTLIAAVTLAVLAERVVRHLLAKRGGGVLIDTRETPPRVSQLAGVPQGFLVLVHADGKSETVRAEEAGPLAELLGKVLRPGG